MGVLEKAAAPLQAKAVSGVPPGCTAASAWFPEDAQKQRRSADAATAAGLDSSGGRPAPVASWEARGGACGVLLAKLSVYFWLP